MPMEETAVDPGVMRKEYQTKKQEMSSLKTSLHSLNTEKEAAYHDLKNLREKISAHTAKIQELKNQRNSLTGQVKELKGERDKLNLVVKEKAQVHQSVGQKKKELQSSSPQESPQRLRAEIARLERKIETEVMSFPKEQELTKQIKILKAAYKKIAAAAEASKEINAVRVEFSESRKKAQDVHQQVQDLAHQSQDVHVSINTLYDEIKAWREAEKKAAERYLQLKEQYAQARQKQDDIGKQLDQFSSQLKDQGEKDFKTKVREKTAEVQEKMKKGKKLSTEDILAFQAMD